MYFAFVLFSESRALVLSLSLSLSLSHTHTHTHTHTLTGERPLSALAENTSSYVYSLLSVKIMA